MLSKLIASFILFLAISGTAYGEGDRLQVWRSSYFDGSDFREGVASMGVSVYRRDGYLPVVQKAEGELQEDRLPSGTGGMVLYCYIQSSGGKLLSQSGSIPVAGAAVEFRSGERKMAVRADIEGYSVVALPSGEYEVRVQGFIRKIRIEKGKNVMMAIRTGKRMVD